ncbi:MAG: ABC transporter permease [Paracoccaceae bacterium]
MKTAPGYLVPLAWRNLWRNPRRTLITLIVVSVGLWSILTFASLMEAWVQSSREATLGLLIGQGQIHAEGYLDDPSVDHVMPQPDADLSRALSAPAIGAWAARLAEPAVIQSEYKTLPVTLMGVDPAAERRISTLPGKVVAGRYLRDRDDDGIVIGSHLAKRLKTEPGRRVILMSQAADGTLAERSFDVIGLFDADEQTEDGYAFTGLAPSQSYLGLTSEISEIAFTVPLDADLPAVIAGLEAAAPALDIRSWRDLSPLFSTIDTYMKGFIYVWLGIMFTLMGIGIVNTQLMAVFERTQEFGLLRALGMRARTVLALVALESALLVGVGVLIGAMLSALTIFSFRGGIDLSFFAQALDMFQTGHVLYPRLASAGFATNSLIIWGLGVLVAFWPAMRAALASPVEAMRHES